MALAGLLAAPFSPPAARGQTIPLRPTPTAEPGTFGVLPVPTPPAPLAAAGTGLAPPPAPRASATVAAAPPAGPNPAPTPPAGGAPIEAFRVEHVPAGSVEQPVPPSGWRVGETLLRVVGTPPAGAAGMVTVVASTRDLAAAGGQAGHLAVFGREPDGAWRMVAGQSADGASRISFRPPAAGVFAVFARALLPADGDYAIPGGRFFRQGQEGGFSVVDGLGGARSAFFTVYTAIGGEAALGRPVSRRFVVGAQLVQAFERGVIVSDGGRAATARAGASAMPIPSGATDPEPPPLAA